MFSSVETQQKKRPKLKTLSYVRYTSNKQKRSLAHGPLRRKWTAERRRKLWKYTATERISYFTQKYPPRSHAVDGMRKCRRRSNEKRKKITDGQPQQLTDWRNLFLTIFSPQCSWNFLRALTEWPSVGRFNFADLFKSYFLVHLF